jgi:hypothetical protein
MANRDGIAPDWGLRSFIHSGARAYSAGWANKDTGSPQYLTERLIADTSALQSMAGYPRGTLTPRAAGGAVLPTNYAPAVILPAPGDTFFDQVFLLPRTVEVGLVLSTKNFTLDLYSSFRNATRYFTTFLNEAGAGIVIPDLPALPAAMPPQSGYTLHLQILTSGPPTIDGDLHFVFDSGDPILHLDGMRTVLFPYEPEAPIVEKLSFLTDIRERQNGTEQRASLRANPRQTFVVTYLLEGDERKAAALCLADAQARAFGLPVWFEGTTLTAAATIGSPTINVGATAYSDLRVNGLAVIFNTSKDYEILEIQSIGGSTITFKSNVTKNFAAGTRVMPVRITFANEVLRGSREVVNLQEYRIQLSALDNGVDLSSTAAWSSYAGKVLLDDPNFTDGSLPETLERRLVVFDNETGVFTVSTPWDASKRGHPKRFFSRTRQKLWEVRQLLHALRGRQVSFYIPTFSQDLEPTASITSGSTVMNVKNVGYTKFGRARKPFNLIRVVFNDGTASIVREISACNEIDANEEQIQVTAAWGVDKTIAKIAAVQLVEKVRLDSDDVELTHLDGNGQAVIEMPVKVVLD